MNKLDNLQKFTKDNAAKMGAKGGAAKKGSKHISTWIQEMLNDEEFTLENFLFNGKQYKGAPIKAIITVGIMQSLQGDNKWAEWLAKHGYGNQINLNVNKDPVDEILKKFGIEGVGSARQTEADASESPQDNS